MIEPLEASVGDVEQDVLRLMLRTNADQLDSRLGQVQAPGGGASSSSQGAVVDALASATRLGSVLDAIVVALVRQARSQGHSWAVIGDALQVSRQAAFQRFGSHPGGEVEIPGRVDDAPLHAERALLQFLDGDFPALRASFNQRMTEGCPLTLLEAVRSRLIKRLGEVRNFGDPTVASVPGYLVVEIPISYQKGERKARIAFDEAARIAGFFVLKTNVP